jgi:hypothetical protein
MSKVWFVTGGSGGLDACGLSFCGLAVWRASGQDASNSSIAKEHS